MNKQLSNAGQDLIHSLNEMARLVKKLNLEEPTIDDVKVTTPEIDQLARDIRTSVATLRVAGMDHLVDSGQYTKSSLAAELGISRQAVGKLMTKAKDPTP